ncbi:N-(5'-phosphoribosyl)anthranilate isomerase [Shimia sp. R11_0]|uniref:N-(5'-phosphoribosyl)anthranilate isomerase n=1 Tax=Shimia marina TaxID=321267 RepID=A0A0P1ETA1_9RHOB|nr:MULTISPECIES: hypothetical protein [Shimia]MBO9477034.1 N-(5'-phosphoribosyl)anthranilate isomerase [Shimia sp. R11_0]CUH53697.1 hypothetical protein SHM7688_03156 [Shimia marina]SFD70720.1 hypothetical protein SAMN04488037_102114 [Shimia marina]
MQPTLAHTTTGQTWLDQVFKTLTTGETCAVKRRVADVDRECGRAALELAVRKRGWHLIETDRDFIILCDTSPFRVIC